MHSVLKFERPASLVALRPGGRPQVARPSIFAFLVILLAGINPVVIRADTSSTIQTLEMTGQLPLTGNPVIDNEFKEKLAAALEHETETQPLPPQLAKRFDDVVRAFDLDQPDLELSAKNLAAKHRSWGLRSSNGANHISPENVKTMPLGAALYTTSSLFDRRSIFDMGALRTGSLIPNLNGQSESGITSKISSKSGKDSKSEKFTMEFGASARFGGWQGSVAFKHDQASEDTKMEGSAKASIYSYVTNTLRIEPQRGQNFLELRGALRGKDLASTDFDYYVKTESSLVDGLPYQKIVRLNPVNYTNGPAAGFSPRAHIQALIKLIDTFAALGDQYHQFASNQKAQQNILLDMFKLKNAIQASIKFFYDGYGDAFVTEVSGYSEVEGYGILKEESGSKNFERNNAGTLTAGYNSFLGGAEASTSVGNWLKESSAYGASSIDAGAGEFPANGRDLGAYIKAIQEQMTALMKNTSTSAVIPAAQITPSFPTAPKLRDWRDDPFSPPDMKEFKDYDAWVASREGFRDTKAWTKPKWLQEKWKNEPANNALPAEAARDLVNNQLNGQASRQQTTEIERVSSLSESLVESVLEIEVRERANTVGVKGVNAGSSKSQAQKEAIYGHAIYQRINQELSDMKKYGKQLIAQQKKVAKQTENSMPLGNGEATGNEMYLDKMMVSNFKALPYTTVGMDGSLIPFIEAKSVLTAFFLAQEELHGVMCS